MGLADALRQYLADANGGALNPEWTPEAKTKLASTLLDFAPVIGGIKGAREEWAAGNPGWAAFNAATVPLDLASLGGATAAKLAVLGAINPGGMQTARKAIEAALDGQRVKPKAIAELTQAQFDGMNALRAKNGAPPLPSRDVDYLGRHHATSRAEDGYAVQDMLKQLISGLDDGALPVVDRYGRVGLESSIKRHDGYGNAVNDLATFNVDGNRTVAEVLSVIPKGDKGRRPADQMKKAGVQPPGFLSGPVSDRSQRIGNIQPVPSLVTEQDVRNWIAQDNAVKLLGLPENNTAMERARAMGFDVSVPLFHGSPRTGKFSAFESGQKNGWSLPRDGHYFTDDKSAAEEFGKVGEYFIKPGNMLDLRGADNNHAGFWRVAEDAGIYDEVRNPYTAVVDGMTQTPEFIASAKKNGFNSMAIPDALGNSKYFDSTVVFNPADIRSVNAAFDPARAHEADLLGHADPRLLGALGLGTAGAAAGAALLPEEYRSGLGRAFSTP